MSLNYWSSIIRAFANCCLSLAEDEVDIHDEGTPDTVANNKVCNKSVATERVYGVHLLKNRHRIQNVLCFYLNQTELHLDS